MSAHTPGKAGMRRSGLGKYHGSAHDRGAADSWYGRPREPHYWPEGTNHGVRVTELTPKEVAAYHAGYDENERSGGKKDWT